MMQAVMKIEIARVDYPAVMRRMRERRASIAVHDAAARVQQAGVDLFSGDGRFADARTVLVGDQRLRFNRAVIATGGRPAAPSVPGLDAVPCFTSETIFTLTELPRRLLVIGAGPIGCELGQAFARFRSAVTMLGQAPQLLPRESPAAASIIRRPSLPHRRGGASKGRRRISTAGVDPCATPMAGALLSMDAMKGCERVRRGAEWC